MSAVARLRAQATPPTAGTGQVPVHTVVMTVEVFHLLLDVADAAETLREALDALEAAVPE